GPGDAAVVELVQLAAQLLPDRVLNVPVALEPAADVAQHRPAAAEARPVGPAVELHLQESELDAELQQLAAVDAGDDPGGDVVAGGAPVGQQRFQVVLHRSCPPGSIDPPESRLQLTRSGRSASLARVLGGRQAFTL